MRAVTKAHETEGPASVADRIDIAESRREGLRPLLFRCGGGGWNIGRELKHLDSVTVDTSPGADIQLDAETLSFGEMSPQLLRYADVPFIRKLRSLLRGRDIAFVVTSLGGFAGGSGAVVVSRVASALSVPVIASVALPFGAEGGVRRAEARRDLGRLQESANMTAAFENNIVLESAPGLKVSQALTLMNRIVSSPIAEMLKHVDAGWAGGLMGKHYRCTYAVDYSSGEGWEKKAAEALLAQMHDAVRTAGAVCLFVESASAPAESAARIARQMEKKCGARKFTVWARERREEGQNRVAAFMLSE